MSLISVLAGTQLVVFVLLFVTNVVSQDTSEDQDTDVFVPVIGGMKTFILCQGKDHLLSCANTSMVLVINKASYGRKEKGKIICPYNRKYHKTDSDDQTISCEENVKEKVKEMCNKRKSCQLSAKKQVFGRPCPGVYKYLQVIFACATKEALESASLSSSTSSSSSFALYTSTSTISDQTIHAKGDNLSLPFTKAIVLDSLPVYVPKNVTIDVTKPNVTTFNDTQSNATIVPTTSITSTQTMSLNASLTTTYATRGSATSAVPYLPSSTVKTIINVKQQPSTSTASYLHYSTSIMGQQSSASFQLSTAGSQQHHHALNAPIALVNVTHNCMDTLTDKDNSSSYIAVFVITAVCASVIIGGVFARCWYLRRRTKSQKFAVLHKPKRFFEPPRQLKQSNGHVTRRASRDINLNDDVLADRPLIKTSELVFTKADIANTTRQKQQTQGLVSNEGVAVSKEDNSTFYVNPMYDRNRQNSTVSTMSTSNPSNHAHRLSNASDSKTGILGSPARAVGKQQMRCNSMGNIPRSSQAGMQRRHPSTGNVASNKDMHQYPHQQSFLYNAPHIPGNFQGQGQGNYPNQGNYPGQQRVINQPPGANSPARHADGLHANKNPITPRTSGAHGFQQGSPSKAQRNRPIAPGSATSYPSPGHQGRRGGRPNSPYQYGSTEKDPNYSGYPGNNDPSAGRYHGNNPGEAPLRRTNAYGDIGITVNPTNSGPSLHRSNGPHTPRDRRSSINNIDLARQPLDPTGKHHGHLEDITGYGKIRGKTQLDSLRSPLDGAQCDPRLLGAPNSESHAFRPNTYESTRPPIHYPAPPDQGSDSSEDDLYSIVAKGNYDSVINDPLNVHQTFRAEKKKHRNPTGSTSRTPRDTSV